MRIRVLPFVLAAALFACGVVALVAATGAGARPAPPVPDRPAVGPPVERGRILELRVRRSGILYVTALHARKGDAGHTARVVVR